MGLILNIRAEECKNSFIVFDCTGFYKFDNLGGFGAPNPLISKVTSAIIYVTPPNIASGINPYAIDVTGMIPNLTGKGVEIQPFQVGQANNQLISGQYLIQLEIMGTDFKGLNYTSVADLIVIFVKNVEDCIDKLQKTVNRDAFKDKKQQAAIVLNELMESAIWAIKCGQNEQAVEIIDLLNSQCTCIDC